MKSWFKFIPLCLLVGYVVVYDVVDQYNHNQPAAQTTTQHSVAERIKPE